MRTELGLENYIEKNLEGSFGGIGRRTENKRRGVVVDYMPDFSFLCKPSTLLDVGLSEDKY